jgi:hypothetical protein
MSTRIPIKKETADISYYEGLTLKLPGSDLIGIDAVAFISHSVAERTTDGVGLCLPGVISPCIGNSTLHGN